MKRTYIHPPDISKYPVWMREYLIPQIFNHRDLEEHEKALRYHMEMARVNLTSKVLFENSMGMIRLRHQLMIECMLHEDIISKLEEKIDVLEKKVEKVEKKKGRS